MTRVRRLAATLSMCAATACSPSTTGAGGDRDAARADVRALTPAVSEIPSPAAEGSSAPNLTAAPDGTVFMTWLAPAGPDGHALVFASYAKGTWSEPRPIASGTDWFVNFADIPSIVAMSDGTLGAHWLAGHVPGTEGARIHLAFSHDRGATWSKPVVPHRDRSSYQHGFVSLIPMPGGGLQAIWLDGRNTKGEGQGDMALMRATIGSVGAVSTDATLDPRACDCCPTSAAVTSEGAVAVYRDRSDKEIRDISIVRFTSGRWSDPEVLSRDEWEINACPVNGPSVSADGRDVVVAWFTAADDQPRVQAVLSSDGGATFGPPVRIDDGQPIGRVDAASVPGGGSMVSWVERGELRRELRVRHINPQGVPGTPVTILDADVAGGVAPRMEASHDQVVLAWTEAGKPSRIRTARIVTR